jgi:hypothetical protein
VKALVPAPAAYRLRLRRVTSETYAASRLELHRVLFFSSLLLSQ